jgi:multidrug efflux pump subunit AcrA (membrane-fusion protein)
MSKITIASALAAALLGSAPAIAAGEGQSGVVVIVAKATNACFSDRVRVAGFLVPQSVTIANVDSEGFKVSEILVNEGDMVTSGQTLARLTRAAQGGAPVATTIVKAPAAGMMIGKSPMVGATASVQAEPLFRIVVDGKIDLEVEVPSLHLPKLKPGATARVAVDGGSEINGRVRTVSSQIDPRGQLGRVRLSLDSDPSLRVGMFAHATIDASRSCGASVPRSAVVNRGDKTTVQVVRGGKVETRNVRLGLLSDNSVEIREGINDGEVVVANAGASLRDGDAVKTIYADETEQARAR